jgi:hypothetical protein
MTLKFTSVLAVVTTLFAGAVLAGGGAGGKASTETPRQGFTQLDGNDDNYISRNEAQLDPTLIRVFNELDRDRDGQLSAAEYGEHDVGVPARRQ